MMTSDDNGDRLLAWYDLAEFAGPEVADAQLVLQEGRDGVARAVRVGGRVRAQECHDMALGGEDDTTRALSLAGQPQLLGQLAFADEKPRLLWARCPCDLVFCAEG